MAIPIEAVISKVGEVVESVSRKEILDKALQEAEKNVEGLWQENNNSISCKHELSTSEIAKEAWDITKQEKSNEINNTIKIHTKNESLENDRHPITGVAFERKIIELPNGERIEGVFPEFDSLFDAYIPKELYLESDKIQFRECNKQLLQELENNPSLKEIFSNEQLEQIEDGTWDGSAPDGYVWHHDAETGKLQLVDSDIHSKTGHTGGRYIWGGGTENR